MIRLISETIPKYFYLFLIVGGAGMLSQSIIDYILKMESLVIYQKSKKFKEEINQLQTKIIENQITQSELNKLLENTNNVENNLLLLKEHHDNLNNVNITEEVKLGLMEKTSVMIDKAFKDAEKGINFIQEILEKSSTKGKNLTINSIYDYFSNLNTLELGAFVHISGSLFILYSLFTIINIIIGDKLIIYLNLEKRLPRLAKFIQYRRKFQHYFLTLNFSLIIFVLLTIIYLNLLILI